MLLSIVIPVFNEEEALPLLFARLLPIATAIDPACEIILIDDGSTDASPALLREAAKHANVRALLFTRNFGHQAAVSAGLDLAAGECVVVMDADLQDPPELLPRMVELYRDGYDLVSPQRQSRQGDSWMKRMTARAFYSLIRRLVDSRVVPEVGDFRLYSRRAVHAIRRFREQHRFLRGLVAWLGLREALLPFDREPRAAGATKYPLHRMLRFAWTAITSFSGLPLRIASVLGLCFVVMDLGLIGYILYVTLVLKTVVPGWASLILVQALFSGVTLLSIGLVGDYISRIYEESKGRPLYVIEEALNADPAMAPPARGVILEPRAQARAASSNRI